MYILGNDSVQLCIKFKRTKTNIGFALGNIYSNSTWCLCTWCNMYIEWNRSYFIIRCLIWIHQSRSIYLWCADLLWDHDLRMTLVASWVNIKITREVVLIQRHGEINKIIKWENHQSPLEITARDTDYSVQAALTYDPRTQMTNATFQLHGTVWFTYFDRNKLAIKNTFTNLCVISLWESSSNIKAESLNKHYV